MPLEAIVLLLLLATLACGSGTDQDTVESAGVPGETASSSMGRLPVEGARESAAPGSGAGQDGRIDLGANRLQGLFRSRGGVPLRGYDLGVGGDSIVVGGSLAFWDIMQLSKGAAIGYGLPLVWLPPGEAVLRVNMDMSEYVAVRESVAIGPYGETREVVFTVRGKDD